MVNLFGCYYYIVAPCVTKKVVIYAIKYINVAWGYRATIERIIIYTRVLIIEQ